MAAPEPAARSQNAPRGILLLCAGIVMFAVGEAAVKYLTADYEVAQIVWARYTFHALVFLLIFSRTGIRHQIVTQRPFLQAGRSILLLTGTVAFFTAIRYLPLAECVAINFVAPLLVTALSIPVLGERVGARRWAAILVGLAGVLVIIRPGLGVMHWAAVLPLGTAACYAGYQIMTRIAARTEDARTSLFWTAAIGFVATSAFVPFAWTPPTPFAWALMIGTGLAFGFGHYLLIRGFEIAPASTLSPFTYTQIIWATLLGLIVFGNFPDRFTLIGAMIVIASGLYIWRREAGLRAVAGT